MGGINLLLIAIFMGNKNTDMAVMWPVPGTEKTAATSNVARKLQNLPDYINIRINTSRARASRVTEVSREGKNL